MIQTQIIIWNKDTNDPWTRSKEVHVLVLPNRSKETGLLPIQVLLRERNANTTTTLPRSPADTTRSDRSRGTASWSRGTASLSREGVVATSQQVFQLKNDLAQNITSVNYRSLPCRHQSCILQNNYILYISIVNKAKLIRTFIKHIDKRVRRTRRIKLKY